ncbi:hypothetical protein AS189_18810 [Arthrobacter alpinus]|uniref:IrrE N-terminal-like domain-containing protein n=1 Tax=Arthrobacter alpinus TaxID=656366 RepID=A0A0S2M367_9MICC|nr:hypothetical protein AS189_18810 [Arthrobacter alpinus]
MAHKGPSVNNRQIRRTAKDAYLQLDFGGRPNLGSIQSWLETERGHPIIILEEPALVGTDLCGLLYVYVDRDVIRHGPPRSSWHRQQIILHEFAHLILGHQHTATSMELTNLPGFPEKPSKVLGRASFEDADEAATEYLADLLAELIRRHLSDEPDDESGFNKVFG